MSFIFDRPMICATVKYIEHSDKSSHRISVLTYLVGPSLIVLLKNELARDQPLEVVRW